MLRGSRWDIALLFAKADEETHVRAWGIPSYNGQDEVCSECLANKTTKPFTYLTRQAQ